MNIFPTRFLRFGHRIHQRVCFANLGQLNDHRQIDTGNNLHAGFVHNRNSQVGRGPAKQIGQQNCAVRAIHPINFAEDIPPPAFHIVIGLNTDRRNLFLRPNNMLKRTDQLFSQPTMCNKHNSDHGGPCLCPSPTYMHQPLAGTCFLVCP